MYLMHFALVGLGWLSLASTAVSQTRPGSPAWEELRGEATQAMQRAANYFCSQVASHGGYVYHYDLSLQSRWGEGEATRDQIWVQPPGTPSVGLAYLAAYQATGDQLYFDAVEETALALVYGQLKSGGWTNLIDFNPQGDGVALYRNGQGKGKNNSSLDDGQTQTALLFLIQADQAFQFQQPEIHEAVEAGVNALLAAQFPCGAFPQVWTGPVARVPPQAANYPEFDWRTEGRVKEYWTLYTLNDNVAPYVAATLHAVHQVYGDERCFEALKRLGDFLVLAQMPEPQPAWAQQYNYAMQPAWARRFEPPAISGHESQDVIALLMDLYEWTTDESYLQPIQPAIDYLRRSTLPDGQIARYYELRSNRPLYMQRVGKVYSLTYDDANLPTHYSWKKRCKVEMLQARYEKLLAGTGQAPQAMASEELIKQVRQVIKSLDGQGRWISHVDAERLVGQPKFKLGDPIISSQVFIDNLELLSQFVLRSEVSGASH